MSATVITIDERGCATLEIPDAGGVVRHYTVALAPLGLDHFAAQVERLDTGANHRVSRWHGTWTCSCDSYRFSRRPRICKHVPEIARLERFLARLGGTQREKCHE